MVAFPFVLGVLAVGLSLFQNRPDPKGRAPRSPITERRTAVFVALCVLLCALFALQTAFADRAVLTQRPLPPWFLQTLPLQFFAPDPPFNANANTWLVQWAQILAVVESTVLLAMYAVLRDTDCRRRSITVVVALSAIFMTAISLHSVVTSVDSYLYVAQGLIWPHQYAPPPVRFAGDDAVLNEIWGMPILPSAYGPLWTPLVALAISGAHTLGQQALAVCFSDSERSRCASPACGVTRRVGDVDSVRAQPRTVRTVFDPLAQRLVGGSPRSRRGRRQALHLVCRAPRCSGRNDQASGLTRGARRVLVQADVTRAVDSGFFSARARLLRLARDRGRIFRSMAAVYAAYDHSPPPLQQAFHLTFATFALAGIALALWRRNFLFGLGWSFPSLGQYALPQYLAWSLPYVLAGNATPFPFLIVWPVVDYTLSLEFAYTPYFLLERFVLVLGVIAAIGYGLLSWRARLPCPQSRLKEAVEQLENRARPRGVGRVEQRREQGPRHHGALVRERAKAGVSVVVAETARPDPAERQVRVREVDRRVADSGSTRRRARQDFSICLRERLKT